jgi:hypothetical protein
MRLQLGQRYDLHTANTLATLCVGEVIVPMEHLAPAHLRTAVGYAIYKHASLRGYFRSKTGELEMHIATPNSALIEGAFDLRLTATDPADRHTQLSEYVECARQDMALLQPPLFRICLFDAPLAHERSRSIR